MSYRISTITAVGNINTIIDLQNFYDIFDLNDDKIPHKESVIYLEYGINKNISNSKGENPKKKKNKKQKKRFDNQLTIILKIGHYINLKLFKNGKIQMTGLKNIDNGKIAINKIIDILKYYNSFDNKISENIKDSIMSNYKICLINSDFKYEHKIKRTDLYKYIVTNTDLICSYEPCIYPGVKIQFYYNENKNGICNCEKYCENKNKNSKCIKITIAIFESGCTIITGSKNIEQINNTYSYIRKLLDNNIDQFKKIDLDELFIN